MEPTTLTTLLKERNTLDARGICFIEGSNQEDTLTYKALYQQALRALSLLQQNGMRPKDELVFQLSDNKTFIIVFWACILGGIIPVPVTVGQNEDHKQKLFNIWAVLNNPYIIALPAGMQSLQNFAEAKALQDVLAAMQNKCISPAALAGAQQEGAIFDARENDIAFIQFSSGSTGNPKGVTLTHKNLLTNIAAISAAANYTANDATISWMPLTHDMGLIGFHLNPLFVGMQQYIIPTHVFVRTPSLWLDKASEHKVSILCSPNFGYKYTLKHCDVASRNWELSSVRILYNGAEPISVELCQQFMESMKVHGLKSTAMCPVYGLAEASLAVSISGLEDEVMPITLDRNKLNFLDEVSEVNEGVRFVNVGRAINDCSIKIADSNNNLLKDGIIGHIMIKGDNVTSGYYNNAKETEAVISADGWLNTGDLGFMQNGCLYITGRAKDIIFLNGRNFYPHDIERIAEEVEGIELNKIAVAQLDETIAFVFHRGSLEKFVPVAQQLKAIVNIKAGFVLDKIIPVKDIPRTTSGKLQRFKLLEQYKRGDFNETEQEMERLLAAQVNEIIAPANAQEQQLLAIWKEVLKIDNIGVTSRFFEAGGNSLKAAELGMRMLKDLQLDLPLQTLYENQTVRELAAVSLAKAAYQPIPVCEVKEYYPVSFAQKRLYYSWELDKNSIAYNIPVAFKVKADAKQLEERIRQLIRRHDSLRMSFHFPADPHFIIADEVDFNLETRPRDTDLKTLVQPFDLSVAPLFRVVLLDDILFADFHHIISDGLSVHQFMQELLNDASAPAVQYKDYACWEKSKTFNAQYWLNQLAAPLPVLELPADFPRPLLFSSAGAKLARTLDQESTKKLHALAKENNCTLHVLLFTIYNLLLSKYSGQEDIIIGIPVSGRTHPDLQQVHGMFVNNLAIRNQIDGHETFAELLQRAKQTIAQALQHQDYPFHELVKQLNDQRDVSRNPVFDTMFIYQNFGETANKHFFDPGFSKFDVSMEVFESNTTIEYAFEYATALFKQSTIEKMAAHFEELIKNISASEKVSSLSIMTPEELHEGITAFNNTYKKYPVHKTIHQLFEEQVERKPNNIALEFEGEVTTYAELNTKANHLAELLKQKGLKPGSIAAIILDRSPQLIISILAVLKAGACYVPIDTDLPQERITYIIENSRCKIVLTDTITETNNDSTANGLAYIIYTSGTTGNPKGVAIEHRSLVNYICWAAESYIKNGKASFPLFTSISFDLTITSIFTPLITGNTIIIYGKDVLVEKIIADNKSNIIKLTPSHLRVIAESGVAANSVQAFIVGGEQLETKLAKEIYEAFNCQIKIYNEYGPTEATVGCMIHSYNPSETQAAVPVGIPAANTQIYLLDQFQQPVPEGVRGEMYIAGDCLAQGYLFNEELTNQRFVENKFNPGTKMYRTGDLARRLPGGIIEYLGRTDEQVKINGYRIELAEIEHHLNTYPGITGSLVIVKHKNLYAYYKSAEAITEAALRNHLAARVPHYMIPVHFIPLEKIPLTSNGKIDHNALPAPVVNRQQSLPENETQLLMLQAWKEVLGEPEISITGNFFEHGGDSIKATQLASKLFEKGIAISVKDILTYHTIEQISLRAQIATKRYEQGLVSGQRGFLPIEHWFFNHQFENPGFYNQSLVLKLKKKISKQALSNAFKKLIAHHDGLRINFDGEKIFYNNRHLENDFIIEASINKNFDLANSLLIKAALIEADLLFITAHHLVIDGVSWRILLEDLFALLEKQTKPPLKTASAKDWQQTVASYPAETEYWKKMEATAFTLPVDATTTDWQAAHAKKISISLNKTDTHFLINHAHQAYKTDVLILLNTALAIALQSFCGHGNLVIEQESHGRELEDVSRTIGWFTAIYPLHLELTGESIGHHIKSVKEQLRKVPAHGFGYGVYKYLNNNSKPQRAQVRFNYLGQFDREMDNELFSYQNISTGSETDLRNHLTAVWELNAMVMNGQLSIEIQYNSKAHQQATMQSFANLLSESLQAVLQHVKEQDTIHFTPSDFDVAGLNEEELDALFS